MAEYQFPFKKSFIALAAVLLAWWLLPAAAGRLVRVSFFEFQAPVWTTLSYAGDIPYYWSLRSRSKNDLIAAGRDLARLNAAYEAGLQEMESLRGELRRLEEILRLPPNREYHPEPARVIRRELNGWWQQMVIQKGADYNIPVGAAVIFAGGVVGRVKEVHLYTSVVELATSRSFRVAAHFEGDARPVIYQGGGNLAFSAPHGQVANAPTDLAPVPGAPLKLVSSRLGGVFPDGLAIGTVRQLDATSDGLFKYGPAQLDPRLLSLREATVLIPVSTQKEP